MSKQSNLHSMSQRQGARPRSGHIVQSLFISIGVWHWSNAAFAQAKDPAAARALFNQARRAVDANDYATACPKFVESYELDPAVGTLLNLADCDKRMGRLATAWAKLQTALEQLPPSDERRPAVQRVAGELEKRVPKLAIRIKPGTSVDCKVARDDVPVGSGSLGVSLPIDPGQHQVAVTAPGRKTQRYDIDLVEGQGLELLVEPGAPESAAPTAAPAGSNQSQPTPPNGTDAAGKQVGPTPTQTEPSHTVAYVAGGLGAALIGVGVVTRVIAFGKQRTLDDHCPNKICDDTGWNARDSASTFQTVSTVTLVAGAAALGIGVYFYLSEPSERSGAVIGVRTDVIEGGTRASLMGSF